MIYNIDESMQELNKEIDNIISEICNNIINLKKDDNGEYIVVEDIKIPNKIMFQDSSRELSLLINDNVVSKTVVPKTIIEWEDDE